MEFNFSIAELREISRRVSARQKTKLAGTTAPPIEDKNRIFVNSPLIKLSRSEIRNAFIVASKKAYERS